MHKVDPNRVAREHQSGFVAIIANECRQVHTRQRVRWRKIAIVSPKPQTTRRVIRGI